MELFIFSSITLVVVGFLSILGAKAETGDRNRHPMDTNTACNKEGDIGSRAPRELTYSQSPEEPATGPDLSSSLLAGRKLLPYVS